MKSLKLLGNTTAACLFMAAASTAMAIGCPDGIIQDRVVNDIEINGESCLIIATTVRGSVTAYSSAAIILMENDISGRIRVESSAFVSVINNRVFNGNINVNNNAEVQVIDNDTLSGSILVYGNDKADVNRNDAGLNIKCSNNRRLDSFLNHADGDDDCKD